MDARTRAGAASARASGGGSWRRALLIALPAAVTMVCCALILTAATPFLLWVQTPRQGEVIGLEGVEVMIRFPREREVDPDTFVAFLNGADVTSEFTTGSNGAFGHLYGVLDGENTLRFEIRGDRGGAPDRLLPETRRVQILVRLPQGIDRG